MTDDMYGDLPDELVSVLRDPSQQLPGELDLFEHVYAWSKAPAFSLTAAPIPGRAQSATWVTDGMPRPLTGNTC